MSDVRSIQCESSSIKVLTGNFVVRLDTAQSRFVIYREETGAKGGFLSFTPGGRDPQLRLLSAEHTSGIDCREDHPATQADELADGDSTTDICVTVSGNLDWASYEVTLMFPVQTPGLIVSQVEVTPTRDVAATEGLFSGEHCEFAFHTANPYRAPKLTYYFNGTPLAFTYHTVDNRGAMLDRNQYIFVGDAAILGATLFSFTDFTSLRPYFAASGTRIFATVRQPPGCLGSPANSYMAQPFTFGYDIPQACESLSEGSSFVISRTIFYLGEGAPGIDEPLAYSHRFLESVSAAYPHVAKPEPVHINWPAVVDQGIQDLFAYGATEDAKPLVLQQCNLNSCKRYAVAFGSSEAERLVAGADELFDAYIPQLPYGDAWQYLFPLIMAGEYATEFGSQIARQKFLGAAGDVVRAGRALGYLFPQRINEDFSKDAETRYEYDCTGAYVFLQLQYYEVTGEESYLEEAKSAAEVLLSMGFEYSYEFTTTALGPLAMLRLHRITGEPSYLRGTCIPLAGIVRHSWLFDPGYREYSGRSIFLLTEGMPGVYANGWEEQCLLRYLALYLEEGAEMIEPPVALLVRELLSYKCSSLADSLAPLLPDPSIVYTGIPREWHRPVRTDWHIPMEGFGYLEWDESGLHDRPGRVSQPPYCFGALAEAALVQHKLGASRAADSRDQEEKE